MKRTPGDPGVLVVPGAWPARSVVPISSHFFGRPPVNWDAAILEAARLGGREVVLSEDLSHDTDYAGVRIENPFLITGS